MTSPLGQYRRHDHDRQHQRGCRRLPPVIVIIVVLVVGIIIVVAISFPLLTHQFGHRQRRRVIRPGIGTVGVVPDVQIGQSSGEYAQQRTVKGGYGTGYRTAIAPPSLSSCRRCRDSLAEEIGSTYHPPW